MSGGRVAWEQGGEDVNEGERIREEGESMTEEAWRGGRVEKVERGMRRVTKTRQTCSLCCFWRGPQGWTCRAEMGA
eukprot:1234051-Rhodomonas_salina.3